MGWSGSVPSWEMAGHASRLLFRMSSVPWFSYFPQMGSHSGYILLLAQSRNASEDTEESNSSDVLANIAYIVHILLIKQNHKAKS